MATNRKLMRERRAAKRDQQRQAEWAACGMPLSERRPVPQTPSPRPYVLPSRELSRRQRGIMVHRIGGAPMTMQDYRLSKVLFAAFFASSLR